MAKLGDIATYINGYAFKPEEWSTEGLPIIRIQDLTGNSYQMNRYDGSYQEKYIVNAGDVLISWSASLGVYLWKGEKALLNQHIFKVVFDKVEVDKSFFVHQVASILEKASNQAHGATMKHLTKPVFDALPFYLPDLATQRRIAATLDKVTEGIAICKQLLSDLDTLVKSRFIEMFGNPEKNPKGWDYIQLGDISFITKLAGFEYTKYIKYQDKGDIIMVRGLNCKGTKLILDDVKWIDKETSDSLPRSKLLKGDIVITYVGTVGEIGLIDADNTYHLAPNVAKLSLTDKNRESPAFWAYMLMVSRDYVIRFATSTTQAALNMEKIRKIRFIDPPAELQNEFVSFLEQSDKSKEKLREQFENLKALKNSLMQKYFCEV